ncbi:lipocalin-like domain-containing protein, partial [Prevotella pectinovora]|uniref:lipocalin-like domain-containing protein n=2 Tax=Prevotellaceae TaxID=171552 RepID=UPI00307C3927
TADKIVGTWVYKEPAVVFESSSLLKQAGGKLVSTAIENKLNTVFNKYGIKAGKFKMTFDKKGNFTQAIAKKTVTGTYTIEGKNVKLTYSGGIQQIMGTTQIDGNSLLIVMDATKLLKFASAAGAMYNNSMLGTISSYLSGVEGMECGVRLEKSK